MRKLTCQIRTHIKCFHFDLLFVHDPVITKNNVPMVTFSDWPLDADKETRGNRAPDVAPETLHDVDKELAGVAHGQVEGLARRSQLGGHGAQVTGGRGSGRSPRGGGGRWRWQSGMHGRRGHLLCVGECVGRGHGWVRVLWDHHHHHGVVGQDAGGVRRHVRRRRLRQAVVVRALGGGVAVLAGRRRAVAASQAAAGGVLGLAAAARARVATAAFAATRGRLLASTHGAAGTFGAAAPLTLAPRRAAAPAPCGRRGEVTANAHRNH